MRAQILAKMLEKRGFNVFYVGGFVRDNMLGLAANDVDLVTNARPEQVEEVFRPNHNVKTVGKSFGVVLVDGVEIATFRTDSYGGLDAKNCKVTYADTIEEDLSRRDFTVNAMAMDLRGNIVDPFGGQSDLEDRVIRFVGNASDRIVEDPNRMLRACRFVAQLDGFLVQKTRYPIMNKVRMGYLDYVSPERIRLEILKAMKTRVPSKFFHALDECGILKEILPSLFKCRYHTGGNYHPEDVFTHSMFTGDAISARCPLTRLAGYLHDVGKPATYNHETGQFLEHEKVGADLVRDELTALKFSNEEIRVVTGLVKMHMRTATVLTDKGVRRLLRKLQANGVHYRDYLRLFLADRNSNLGLPKMSIDNVRQMVNTVEDQMSVEMGVTKVKDLAVNGHDVMRINGFPPGPRVGQILEHLLTVVVDDPNLNTRENLENILQTS
jgi:tRNA nucleotidyltransferase (CCA-adding enzyme)